MNRRKENYIINNYGSIRAQDLADALGITIHQVYGVARRNNLTRRQNKKVEIDSDMHQVLVSGILGDGRLKRNGKHNFYYSECHALGEREYLLWKKKMLKDLTNNSTIYGKNLNNDYEKAVEFTSLTTPSLIPYSKLSKKDCIKELEELGLFLLIMDDGWGRRYKNSNGLVLSFNNDYLEELEILKDRYCEVLGIECKIIGIKKKVISFSHIYEHIFKDIASRYGMEDLDVVKKKLSPF